MEDESRFSLFANLVHPYRVSKSTFILVTDCDMDILRQSIGPVRKCISRTRRSALTESRTSDHSTSGLIL